MEKGWLDICRADYKVGTGEQVGGDGQVTGTGGKGVSAGQEGDAGVRVMAETGGKVRGHLVDR